MLASRNLAGRPRGLIGAPFNNTNPDITAMMAAFERYNAQAGAMAGHITDINAELDRVGQQLAGLRIEGPRGAPGAGVISAAERTSFKNFLRTGAVPQAAMSNDSNPDGGYLTSREVDTVVANQLRLTSAFRQYARVVTTTAGIYNFFVNRRGGGQSGWVGERDTRTETNTPQLGALTPPLGEIYAAPKVTQRFLDDSEIDIEAFLSENFSEEFGYQEDIAFISGDGNNKPSGILTRNIVATGDATRAFGDLQYIPTGNATGFDFSASPPAPGDVLLSMIYKLGAPYRAGTPGVSDVAWMMNSTTAAAIRKFKDTSGWYLWQPANALGQPETLAGYPVAINENMPDLGANTCPIAFGNWKLGYRIVDRTGIRIIRDNVTSKPNIIFYATKRVAGCVADSNAIKLLKCAVS